MSDPAAVHCTDHPDQLLVRAYDRSAPVNVQADQRQCVHGDHPIYRRVRCAWCGGPIGGRRPWAAVYCGVRCRVAALRARRTMTNPPAANLAATPSGPNAGAMSAPGETVQEVQE